MHRRWLSSTLAGLLTVAVTSLPTWAASGPLGAAREAALKLARQGTSKGSNDFGSYTATFLRGSAKPMRGSAKRLSDSYVLVHFKKSDPMRSCNYLVKVTPAKQPSQIARFAAQIVGRPAPKAPEPKAEVLAVYRKYPTLGELSRELTKAGVREAKRGTSRIAGVLNKLLQEAGPKASLKDGFLSLPIKKIPVQLDVHREELLGLRASLAKRK